MSEAVEAVQPIEQVSFSFESKTADILAAAQVVDKKNRVESRRNLQGMGLIVVLWMFVPDIFENPTRITSWIMVAVAISLIYVIWKYPDRVNQKFAESKVQNAPHYDMTVTSQGIDVTEGDAHYQVSFAGSTAVFDYKQVFAVLYDKNRLLTIPKDQLEEATLQKVRGLFCQGLGDRFEKVEESTAQMSMFGRKKR